MNKVTLLSQDDYFLPVDSPKHKMVEKLGHINWEILSSIDMDKMCHDIMTTLGHKFILYNCHQLSKSEGDNNIAEQVDPVLDEDNIFADHFLSNYLNKYDDGSVGVNQRTSNLIKKFSDFQPSIHAGFVQRQIPYALAVRKVLRQANQAGVRSAGRRRVFRNVRLANV